MEERLSERNCLLPWNKAGDASKTPIGAVVIDSLRHDKKPFANIPLCGGYVQVMTIIIVVIKQIRKFFLDNGFLMV